MSRGNSHRIPRNGRKKGKAGSKGNSGNNLEPKLQNVRQVEDDSFMGFLEEVAASGAVMLAPTNKFKHAVIGIDTEGRYVYSRERILDVFMKDGMSLDEADEFCSYNTERALVYVEEEKRPIILAFIRP